jgi:hypothetical protein
MVARHTLKDDMPVHSFGTLMTELATIVRNSCRTPMAPDDSPSFEILTTANAKQQQALALLRKTRSKCSQKMNTGAQAKSLEHKESSPF